jgi:hypothetical protein
MRRMQLAGLSGMLSFLVVSLFPLASVNQASTHSAGAPRISVTAIAGCADPPDTCRLPVKYLGEKDGCACFSCEHGRRTQRIICTANEDDKIKLIARVKER